MGEPGRIREWLAGTHSTASPSVSKRMNQGRSGMRPSNQKNGLIEKTHRNIEWSDAATSRSAHRSTRSLARHGLTYAKVIEGVTAVVKQIRTKLPQSKLLLLAVFPRGVVDAPQRAQIKEINAAIAQLDDGKMIKFLDIGKVFLADDGSIASQQVVERPGL